MHYLIFIPNKRGANPANLAEVGLPGASEGALCADLTGAGPGGSPGQVWSWSNSAIPVYLPDRQDWTQCGANWWLGVTRGNPPKPTDLIRRNPIDGLTHRLADGNDWVIASSMRIPTTYALGPAPDYEPIKVPAKEFAPYVERCDWALNAALRIVKGEDVVEHKEMLAFAAEVLGIVYRINLRISVVLGLLRQSDLFPIMGKASNPTVVQEAIAKRQYVETLAAAGAVPAEETRYAVDA